MSQLAVLSYSLTSSFAGGPLLLVSIQPSFLTHFTANFCVGEVELGEYVGVGRQENGVGRRLTRTDTNSPGNTMGSGG